ncbi:MAG: hypothetical protein FJX06_21175, partial [Alphaproteobacteria bacterium]|nr:hypothetical protein [Alphaproteobacteria bacterium]
MLTGYWNARGPMKMTLDGELRIEPNKYIADVHVMSWKRGGWEEMLFESDGDGGQSSGGHTPSVTALREARETLRRTKEIDFKAPVDVMPLEEPMLVSNGYMTRAAPRSNAKRSGPPAANQSRAATITPGSYDAKNRTLQVILSTGADVRRFGFLEQLNMDPSAVDISRVAGGQVKFLDSHNQLSIGAVLGTLTDARFESGRLVGTVQLGESDAALAAEPDIASGHLKGVSIGYRVEQWTNVTAGDIETWRADRWTLMECSLVSVPADAGAMVRTSENDEEDDDETAVGAQPTRGRRKEKPFSVRDYKLLAEYRGGSFKQTLDRLVEENAPRDEIYEAHRIHERAMASVNPPFYPRANLHEEMARASLGE